MYKIYDTKERKWVAGTHVSYRKLEGLIYNKSKNYSTVFHGREDAYKMCARLNKEFGGGFLVAEQYDTIVEISDYEIEAARSYEIEVPQYIVVPLRRVEDEMFINEILTDQSESDTPDWVEFTVSVGYYEVIA